MTSLTKVRLGWIALRNRMLMWGPREVAIIVISSFILGFLGATLVKHLTGFVK